MDLLRKIASKLRLEAGATMVEYGLMVALIAIIAITAVGLVGDGVVATFEDIADAL